MKRMTGILMLTSLLAFGSGCAMCCAPFDYDYTCYGGRYERIDRTEGRVGSKFAPAHDVSAAESDNLGQPPDDVTYESRPGAESSSELEPEPEAAR